MSIVDTRTPDPKKFIKGATGDWEIVIGMEVHAQVTSNAKLFSGASTEFGKDPNANVSLVNASFLWHWWSSRVTPSTLTLSRLLRATGPVV